MFQLPQRLKVDISVIKLNFVFWFVGVGGLEPKEVCSVCIYVLHSRQTLKSLILAAFRFHEFKYLGFVYVSS